MNGDKNQNKTVYELITPSVELIKQYSMFWGCKKGNNPIVQLFQGQEEVNIWDYIDMKKFANYEMIDNQISALFDEGLIQCFFEKINSCYSTRVKNITNILISKIELESKDFDEFMDICKKATGSYTYSFATKVFSFIYPDKCPILDSRSVTFIWNYFSPKNKKAYPRAEWGNYKKYRNAYKAFILQYNLNDVTLKEIDRFLWTYATAIRNYWIKELGLIEYMNISYIPQNSFNND